MVYGIRALLWMLLLSGCSGQSLSIAPRQQNRRETICAYRHFRHWLINPYAVIRAKSPVPVFERIADRQPLKRAPCVPRECGTLGLKECLQKARVTQSPDIGRAFDCHVRHQYNDVAPSSQSRLTAHPSNLPSVSIIRATVQTYRARTGAHGEPRPPIVG